MILFYYNSEGKDQARLIQTLCRHTQGQRQLVVTKSFDPTSDIVKNARFIIFAGMIRGNGLIYKWCVENNKDFYYLDHAYLDSGYKRTTPANEWMRITKNNFLWNQLEDRPADRWDTHFSKKYPLQPWRSNNGKNILVLPPSQATQYLFPDSINWMKAMLADLKKLELPIVIREKPTQPRTDENNKVVEVLKYTHEKTIEEEMEDARMIVTYSSAVPVLGTIKGIPCITSKMCAAYPISQTIDTVMQAEEPNRLKWLHQLVYHQYNTEEMSNRKIWNLLGD